MNSGFYWLFDWLEKHPARFVLALLFQPEEKWWNWCHFLKSYPYLERVFERLTGLTNQQWQDECIWLELDSASLDFTDIVQRILSFQDSGESSDRANLVAALLTEAVIALNGTACFQGHQMPARTRSDWFRYQAGRPALDSLPSECAWLVSHVTHPLRDKILHEHAALTKELKYQIDDFLKTLGSYKGSALVAEAGATANFMPFADSWQDLSLVANQTDHRLKFSQLTSLLTYQVGVHRWEFLEGVLRTTNERVFVIEGEIPDFQANLMALSNGPLITLNQLSTDGLIEFLLPQANGYLLQIRTIHQEPVLELAIHQIFSELSPDFS